MPSVHKKSKPRAGTPLRNCLVCGDEFSPTRGRDLYCGSTCRWRAAKRRRRERLRKAGLCPQCGAEMPAPAAGERKETISYCEMCQRYFKRVYREKKGAGPE